MCEAISLSWRELPEDLIRQHQLVPIMRDQGEREYQFFKRQRNARLPVWHEGQLQLLPWQGYCEQEVLEAGRWLSRHPIPVDIPATFGCDHGVWYLVREGFRGVIAEEKVYLLRQPSSHYYEIMTRNKRMPVMIGEGI